MHRHGYSGSKLSLTRAPRRALLRGQVTALVLREQITTTAARAKETQRQFDHLVTRAKLGGLANVRHVHSFLLTDLAAQKLLQDLVPALQERTSGYARFTKVAARRGDNAPMAVLTVLRREQTKAAATASDQAETTATPKTAKSEPKPAASATPAAARNPMTDAPSRSKLQAPATARRTQRGGDR